MRLLRLSRRRTKGSKKEMDGYGHFDPEIPLEPDERLDSSQAFWQSNLASLKEYVESMED